MTFCCLVSSYIYVAMAAFRTSERDYPSIIALSIIFEGVFVLDIIINFMLSYERNDTATE